MDRIEDMSETQRQSWVTLIVDGFVFIWFLQRMTYGGGISLQLERHSAGELSSIIVGVIIVTIILHAIIASVFALRKRQEDSDAKDERDIEIERRGASLGFYVVSIGLTILVGHVVIQNGLNAIPEITEKHQSFFDYTDTSHLVFAMSAIIFTGDIVKNATMVLAYRGE